MDVKGDAGEGSGAVKKASVTLEIDIYDHEQSVGRNMKRVLLVRSQMEMWSMLLETGGKAVIKWQKTWLNCVSEVCGK